jgi:hypothetical protein
LELASLGSVRVFVHWQVKLDLASFNLQYSA